LSLEELLDVTIAIAALTEQRSIDAPATVYLVTREDILCHGWRDRKEILASIPNIDYFCAATFACCSLAPHAVRFPHRILRRHEAGGSSARRHILRFRARARSFTANY
jgi:hypothetical protein